MFSKWWQKLTQKSHPPKSADAVQTTPPSENSHASKLTLVFDVTREPKLNLGLPPNAIPGLSVIKELSRLLRYKTLDQLVGLKVEVTSLNSAVQEIRAAIGRYDIELGDIISDSGDAAFRKYGLLDYSFLLVQSNFIAERQNVRFLKEMGWLLEKEDVDDLLFPDGGIGFLQEMIDQIKENNMVCDIRLESCGRYRGLQDAPSENWQSVETAQFFPCEFIVRDACITNCRDIWLNKYFYL